MPVRAPLPPWDLLLALAVVVLWGLSFPVTEGALSALPPLLVAGLRFALVALCCLFVPRPEVPWRWILLVGLFTATGQYGLLYLGMSAGMPSGLSALVIQAQVPLTIVVAAVVLKERPTPRRLAGLAISTLGLLLVGLTRGGSIPASALLLVLGAAASWSVGNVCTRVAPFAQKRPSNGFRLIIWASLVPPLPLFALSLTQAIPGGRGRGVHAEWDALAATGSRAWLTLAYLVVLGTIAGMSGWTYLLGKYPADRVTPYALGIPVVALLLSRVLVNESISSRTLGACAIVLAGLTLVAFPTMPAKTTAAAATNAVADAMAEEPAG